MLVLTRKVDESVVIEPDVEVRILYISRNKVKLGFVAPRCVPVYRKEISFATPGSFKRTVGSRELELVKMR